MHELPYDIYSQESILAFGKKLQGKSLGNCCDIQELENKRDKGGFGKFIEKLYFLYEPNSDAQADFVEAGLELKVTPLKKLKNNTYRAKERLVLNIINYMEVVNQNFYNSSFWKKNAHLLLLFYLYEKEKSLFDYVIKFVNIWNFPELDLEIIKKDWQIIQAKILEGKAHELSEGDTFYLAACTKGAKGGNFREQPYSKEKAKQRAYSLKQGYMNHIIATISKKQLEYGKLIPSLQAVQKQTIEELVLSKFYQYYNKSIDDITEQLSLKLNQQSKNFYANITKAILGISLEKEIEEFAKADIIVKTVRLKQNGIPKEDISFPKFEYRELVQEIWDTSTMKALLEQKFFFVFFQFEGEILVLKKVKFWNMPYKEILEVEKVWNKTRNVVQSGKIVKYIKEDKNKKQIRYTNFPNKKFSYVAHVRPHARNSQDTSVLPIHDILTGNTEYTKHCFWLNASYVKDYIYTPKDNI